MTRRRKPRPPTKSSLPATFAQAEEDLTVAAPDFGRPVIYRGIKIDPIAGKRSSVARAIRDDLRKQAELARRKLGYSA